VKSKMKSNPTLRQRVSQISVGVFLASLALMLAGFILYSFTKNAIAIREVETDLNKSSAQQIEQLIPSFLLPEQRVGVLLLLEKYRREDALSDIQIITEESQRPASFSDCVLGNTRASFCQNANGKESAVLIPIVESGNHFGWLFKARPIASAIAARDLLQMIGIFIFVLALTFTVIYILTARMLSRTMPRALDDLVEWIEADLAERPSTIATLPFKELEDLKEKISEVLERYSKERDQAVVGQLTSGIMHDIKTPLQSLVTARLLLERAPEASEKRTQFLENLATVCNENLPVIESIVETTLDGSRKIALSLTDKDLSKTIRKSIELNQQCAELHHVSVEVVMPSGIELTHDSSQMLRVTHNLLKNAIEAAAESSSAKKVQIVFTALSSEEVQITVEDSGPGIPCSPDKIFRVFKSSKIRGSGLGLTITKKIVEAHGGTITAGKSASLGGAKFKVVLPRIESSRPGEILL